MNKQKQGFAARLDKIIAVGQLAGEDAFSELSRSEYSMKDVLDIDEFRSLSKEIRLQHQQESKLVDSFYYPQWKPKMQFQRTTQPLSPYQQEYCKWKGEGGKQDAFRSTYTSTLALINKQQQKQEVERLLREYSIDQAILSYSPQNPLSHINKDYTQSLAGIAGRQFLNPSKLPDTSQTYKHTIDPERPIKPDPITSWKQSQQIQKNQQKQALIELQVQQQLLNRLKQINEEQKREQQKAKRQRQLKKACFKQLIERPPNIHPKQQKPSPRKVILQSTRQINLGKNQKFQQMLLDDAKGSSSIKEKEKSQKKARYKLNVDQILKIPHRLFLIFYSENYHQIIRLSSPQELKKINAYRSEALKRQQAVEILKKKVAQQGSELVSQLPSQLKQKLFKILYDQDLQEERYAQERN